MKETKNESVGTTQFLLVDLNRERYGINIKYVHSIIRMSHITRVPKAPNDIRGVINLRGEIIPVMCLRKKFTLSEAEETKKTRIIIVAIEDNPMGLIVDAVAEVRNLPDSQIQSITHEIQDEQEKYIYAIGKTEEELVTLLDVDALIGRIG